jgi:hypothetical protein
MRPLLPICACAALAVCADIPTAAARDELDAAFSRWQAAGIADYSYDVRVSCYCLDERTRTVRAEVRNGVPVSLTYVDSGTAADTAMFDDVRTMDRLFATLRQAVEREPYDWIAQYDGTWGIPLSVAVDYDATMVDDEIGYVVTSFGPVAVPLGDASPSGAMPDPPGGGRP